MEGIISPEEDSPGHLVPFMGKCGFPDGSVGKESAAMQETQEM